MPDSYDESRANPISLAKYIKAEAAAWYINERRSAAEPSRGLLDHDAVNPSSDCARLTGVQGRPRRSGDNQTGTASASIGWVSAGRSPHYRLPVAIASSVSPAEPDYTLKNTEGRHAT
jgi:hypothetical protein